MIDQNRDDVGLKSTDTQSDTTDVPSPEPDGNAATDDHRVEVSANEIEGTSVDSTRAQRRLSFSISARSVVLTALIVVLAGALSTFAWLYVDAHSQLNAQARIAEDNAHSEKLALEYAVNAATMNYQDIGTWKTKLVAGTTPELTDKLTKAADSMQQILVPLQWTSSAKPLAAKVRSSAGSIYVVDCFVSVQTKTVQAPDPLQSTATYSLTLDGTNNWQITDVGGIGAVTGQR